MGILALLARRFVAGETLSAALRAVRRLDSAGLRATVDHLGENVTDRAAAAAATGAYLALLEALQGVGLEPNVSLKLTQLGLDLDEGLCSDHVGRVVERARELGGFVRVDMEGSAYTERTLALVLRWHAAFPGSVGAVLQAALRRTAEDVERCNEAQLRVRLCKGAYREPPAVAFAGRHEVGDAFARLAEQLLQRGSYPAIATHDPALIAAAQASARRAGKSRDDYEFQMLYGIFRSGQRQLVAQGQRVRVYTPYGTHWLPYFGRRLRERRENVWFLVRHLVGER